MLGTVFHEGDFVRVLGQGQGAHDGWAMVQAGAQTSARAETFDAQGPEAEWLPLECIDRIEPQPKRQESNAPLKKPPPSSSKTVSPSGMYHGKLPAPRPLPTPQLTRTDSDKKEQDRNLQTTTRFQGVAITPLWQAGSTSREDAQADTELKDSGLPTAAALITPRIFQAFRFREELVLELPTQVQAEPNAQGAPEIASCSQAPETQLLSPSNRQQKAVHEVLEDVRSRKMLAQLKREAEVIEQDATACKVVLRQSRISLSRTPKDTEAERATLAARAERATLAGSPFPEAECQMTADLAAGFKPNLAEAKMNEQAPQAVAQRRREGDEKKKAENTQKTIEIQLVLDMDVHEIAQTQEEFVAELCQELCAAANAGAHPEKNSL